MRFYLGTHRPHWLKLSRFADVPLFVSTRQIEERCRRDLPRAVTDWALDSGGFTELAAFGGWETSADEYARRVDRYAEEIGRLEWVAPQDWMVEPVMLERTGLTVADHQELTIDSFVELSGRGLRARVVPVLQGWTVADYERHVERYAERGVDLTDHPTVGLGSVCRREGTNEAETIVLTLSGLIGGERLHGFGMKTTGLARIGDLLGSADSLAWSYAGRKRPDPSHGHKRCGNCQDYAIDWRSRILEPTVPTFWSPRSFD